MPSRVSWCVKHLHSEVTKLPGVPVSKGHINARDAPLISLWTHNCALELAFQLLVAPSVIPMMMCVKNVIKLQTSATMITEMEQTGP